MGCQFSQINTYKSNFGVIGSWIGVTIHSSMTYTVKEVESMVVVRGRVGVVEQSVYWQGRIGIRSRLCHGRVSRRTVGEVTFEEGEWEKREGSVGVGDYTEEGRINIQDRREGWYTSKEVPVPEVNRTSGVIKVSNVYQTMYTQRGEGLKEVISPVRPSFVLFWTRGSNKIFIPDSHSSQHSLYFPVSWHVMTARTVTSFYG